jgi:hypothetical protein
MRKSYGNIKTGTAPTEAQHITIALCQRMTALSDTGAVITTPMVLNQLIKKCACPYSKASAMSKRMSPSAGLSFY